MSEPEPNELLNKDVEEASEPTNISDNETSIKDHSDEENEENSDGKKKRKAGVIYLSRIPTKMNVRIIRDYFSEFGEVDRIFLEPREKKRKNETRSFSEGWVEFKSKRTAKAVAARFNNKQCGGKRKNPWYSELWNIKYLKRFRWTHLNERMSYEQELRKQRLRQEVNLAKKETSYYIQNVEKNERKKRLEKKAQKDQSIESNETSSKQAEAQNNEENDQYVNKRPKLYERKTKIAGNDTFLKQIFS